MAEKGGYKIEKEIYSGRSTVIYHGTDETGKPVVLKALRAQYPSVDEMRALEREFAIAGELDGIPGVVKVLKIVEWGNGKAMVMEDMGGESLDAIIAGKPMKLEQALDIA